MKENMKIVLVGNPNCGKTTIFNNLTGMNQKIGNWAGVTVEKKEGFFKINGKTVSVTDLPGIYSLSPQSIDEEITVDYLKNEEFDLVINIIDSSNIERNLYLTQQLIQQNLNMLLVYSMSDLTEEKGVQIDYSELNKLIKKPFVQIIGKNKKDTFKIIENIEKISNSNESFEKNIKNIESSNQNTENIYENIKNIVNKTVKFSKKNVFSKKIDKIVLNKFLGYPILAFLFWLMFYSTFTIAKPLVSFVEDGIAFIKQIVDNNLTGVLQEVVSNGIIDGVGGVIVFVPNIFILFLLISLFENSGYMPRAAFLLDKIMNKVGLQGKSFVPLLMGFGCNIPGMMATRTIGDENSRIVTLLLNPFVTCSARLPVYVLISAVFFPQNPGLMLTSVYFSSILVVFIGAKILTTFIFKTNKNIPFIFEMPLYQKPQFKMILLPAYLNSWHFIKKMGSVILIGSVLIWALSNYPKNDDISQKFNAKIEATTVKNEKQILEFQKKEELQRNSYIGIIGKTIAPIFKPLGFDYKDSIAVITGFVAKEIVVSTYGILYSAGDEVDETNETLITSLQKAKTNPLFPFSLMIFILLYIPCLGTVVTLKRELNSTKKTVIASFGYFGVAYLISAIVYQIGNLFI